MSISQIRQQLHEYIDSAEDKKLKAIFTLFENDLINDYSLTPEQKKELDKRYQDHQNGVGRTYT